MWEAGRVHRCSGREREGRAEVRRQEGWGALGWPRRRARCARACPALKCPARRGRRPEPRAPAEPPVSCSSGRGHDGELGQSAHRPGGPRRRRVLQPPGEYRSPGGLRYCPRPAGVRTTPCRVCDWRVTELGRWGQIRAPSCGLGVAPHAGVGAEGGQPQMRAKGKVHRSEERASWRGARRDRRPAGRRP